MWRPRFERTDGEVFVEQIRLLLGNVGSSVLPAYLLAVLMAAALSKAGNPQALWLWCALVMVSKTVDHLHARFYLGPRLTPANAPFVHWQLLGLHALDASAWASLALIVLADASMVEFMLVNSVLAGIAGSSMSLLAPVLSVFVTFVVVEFSIVAYKFWLLGDSTYWVLTAALVLYFCSLTLQARNSNMAALASIRLRFENRQLVGQLQDETAKAVAAHQEAVDANTAKSKFLAAASHDLRQPVHALGLFLGVLSGTKLDPEQRQMVSNAQSVTLASSEMLNTLLDFSRIEAGVVEVQKSAFRAQDLLFKLEQEFAPQANAHGLVWRCRESAAVLWSDPKLVELIVRNLASNAIRYTDRGGILMACRLRGAFCVIEVWDTGMGIEKSMHQDIFKEFYQLGNSERDRRKGLGLGLAIASGLAARLDIGLSLASVPGRGSVFRLRIPLAKTPWPGLSLASLSVPAAQNLQGVRVLVLDDDEAVREGMGQLLTSFGCECRRVETLEEALQCEPGWRPDLFISDYRLRDGGDGLRAIERLRQTVSRSLPCLLITGDTAPARIREAHQSGVRLLHKPVSPEALQQAMHLELRQRTEPQAVLA